MKNGSKLYCRLAPCLFVSFSLLVVVVRITWQAKDWNLEWRRRDARTEMETISCDVKIMKGGIEYRIEGEE